MRICQVTPGLIQIPPNGWGAIEKIIWEYKQSMDAFGHQCDIKFLNDVYKNEYDIIHIHVANLCLEAYEKGIPYVFTMHDHHTEYYGKESELYKQNKEAIEKSIISFVPAQHLVQLFESPKVVYLRHGVNSSFFTPPNYDIPKLKLLCVGNNGLCGNVGFDRKGFLYAIEAARTLNMPLTIAGPDNNKKFFSLNPDYVPYEKLSFLYNLNEEDLRYVYQTHSIFLHPSSLEAGHPNLTLLEAMSCGLPVVSTFDSDPLPGMKKIERTVDSVVDGIKSVVSDYSECKRNSREYAVKNDWKNVVSDLIGYYRKIDEFRMKNELLSIYDQTLKKSKQSQKPLISIDFHDGSKLSVSGGEPDVNYSFRFCDSETNEVYYSGDIKTNHWAKCNVSRYVPYDIQIYNGSELLVDYKMDLQNKNVLIILDSMSLGDSIAWFPYVEEFRKKHNCIVSCSSNWGELFQDNYPNIKCMPLSWSGDFYAIYRIGCFFEKEKSKFNYKDVSLSRIASSILGLDDVIIKPNIVIKDKVSRFSKKYVCFTMESTAQAKLWNNPTGWQEVVNYLNSVGLEPVLIQVGVDKSLTGIRNLSGKKSIHDTINYLYNCEFFIGLGSGLSWLAWSLNKPVIMISGFSDPKSEFYTPHRIINRNVCNSCWNEHTFDKGDWKWCPRQKGTDREFECSKRIGSDMVIGQINKLIGVK